MGDAEQALLKMSPLENAAVDVGAGTIEVIALQPILYWKNATQQGLPLSLNPRMLYRGLSTSVVNMATLTGLQFPLTGAVAKAITGGEERPLGDGEKVGAAFCGGFISGLACGPFELTMIQQQRFGGSTLGTPARIVSEYGAAAIGRGITTTIGREAMFTMSMLGVTPLIQEKLVASSGMEKNAALAAGSLTGALLAGVATHPLDTIKSCMQGDLGREKYDGIVQTGRSLATEYGVVQGLFKGLFWRVALISTTFFLVNTFKQQTVPLLFPHAVQDEPEKKSSR